MWRYSGQDLCSAMISGRVGGRGRKSHPAAGRRWRLWKPRWVPNWPTWLVPESGRIPPSWEEEGEGGSAEKERGQHPQDEAAGAGAAAAEVRGVRKGSRMLPEAAGVGDRQGGQSAIQAATLAQSQPLDMRLQQDAASLGGRREARAVKRAGTTERTSSQEAVEELERRSQEEGQRRGCRRGPISGEKKAKE